MSDFKVQRGMIIRALKDQPPVVKGRLYRVIDVNSNLTLDGLQVRLHLDHNAWQEAHLPYVDEEATVTLEPVVEESKPIGRALTNEEVDNLVSEADTMIAVFDTPQEPSELQITEEEIAQAIEKQRTQSRLIMVDPDIYLVPLPPPTVYGKVLNFFKRGDKK